MDYISHYYRTLIRFVVPDVQRCKAFGSNLTSQELVIRDYAICDLRTVFAQPFFPNAFIIFQPADLETDCRDKSFCHTERSCKAKMYWNHDLLYSGERERARCTR